MDQHLIPVASNGESEVFYLRMKADYHRYIAEVTTGDAKAVAASSAEAAYVAAAAVAVKDLEVTHPIRWGLALNYSCTRCSRSRTMLA